MPRVREKSVLFEKVIVHELLHLKVSTPDRFVRAKSCQKITRDWYGRCVQVRPGSNTPERQSQKHSLFFALNNVLVLIVTVEHSVADDATYSLTEGLRKVTDSMRCSITWSEDLNTSDQSDQAA